MMATQPNATFAEEKQAQFLTQPTKICYDTYLTLKKPRLTVRESRNLREVVSTTENKELLSFGRGKAIIEELITYPGVQYTANIGSRLCNKQSIHCNSTV